MIPLLYSAQVRHISVTDLFLGSFLMWERDGYTGASPGNGEMIVCRHKLDVYVVYLDLSKTSDTASNSILLETLAAHSLDRWMLC